jgi:hypothetical protein
MQPLEQAALGILADIQPVVVVAQTIVAIVGMRVEDADIGVSDE